MTTQEVANKLVELCRQGKYEEAQANLYADSAVSLEPEGGPWPARVEGLDNIKAKAAQWEAMVEEVHSLNVSEPVAAGTHFSIAMENEVTFKGMGRNKMAEIALYEVADGKIVKEQFFYPMAPQN